MDAPETTLQPPGTAYQWQQWVQYLKHRMNTDYDNVILIDGYEGSGKSTLAMHLMDAIDPDWEPESNVVFRWKQNRDLWKTLPRKSAILIDEGANVLFSRDAMRGANRWFGKMLFQCRQLNNTLILCIPNKRWLDSIGREHRSQYWCHVHKRGQATVLERRENWYQGTVWYESAFDLGFTKYEGPQVAKYLEMKLEAMNDLGESEAPVLPQEQTQDYGQRIKELQQAYG